MKTITISKERASELMFGLGSPGVCLSCGYFDEYAGCEPDARNYHCPECEQNQLYGFEEAMMMGAVSVK